MKRVEFIQPDELPNPKVPGTAPISILDPHFTLGKISTGGMWFPFALIIQHAVIKEPLSAVETVDTSLLPVGAITFDDLLVTVRTPVSSKL